MADLVKSKIQACYHEDDFKTAQGIIFVVGVEGADGTTRDVANVERTFKQLNFAVYDVINPTAEELATLMKAAGDLDYPLCYKYVAFYFAGHGGIDKDGKQFIVGLQTEDSQKKDVIHIDEYIINPLKPLHDKNKSRLFFFDCCQSEVEDVEFFSGSSRAKPPPGQLVAFASNIGQKSWGDKKDGGIWTRHLCENLRKFNESITDILAQTYDDVVKIQHNFQQPLVISSIGRKILNEDGNSFPAAIFTERIKNLTSQLTGSVGTTPSSQLGILGQPNHKSTNESMETTTEQQRYHVQVVSSYLQRFDLLKYYPQKLSLQNALEIRESTLNRSSTTDLKLLPFIILHKILAYDYECIHTLLPDVQQRNEVYYRDDPESNSDSGNDEPDEIDSSSYESNSVHPIDCIIALFLCADDFLRQDMMFRLSSCQMSIPFLLRDPLKSKQKLTFPLWALRSIVKTWRTVEPNGKHTSHEYQMVTQSFPIVTFMRLGKHKHVQSKSKLLNAILSLTGHHHFFHRDMNGGELKRLLSNGLVDLCWYLPGGKEDDIFPQPVAFLNLHGSACSKFNQKQVEFLSKISSLTFMLVAGKELDDLSCDIIKKFSSCTLLLTSDKKPTNLVHEKIISVKIDVNADKIKRNIQTEIKETLFAESARSVSYKTIESLATVSRDLHITVDEDHEILKKASNYAELTYKLVEPKQSYKDTALPLQGKKVWHTWAEYDKEQYRQAHRGNEEVSKYSDAIVLKKRQIRNDQTLLLDRLSPIMTQFIQYLQGIQDKSSQNYFLYCLKLGLNNISRSSISTVHHEYLIYRSAELSQIQTLDSSTESEEEKLIKNNLNQKIIDLAFGFEHLLREVGQVYETAIRQDSLVKQQQFASLPTSVANLLIDGYPFEIMDGDAAHVPIDWVTAVLKEVGRLLGNPRVFVLSVLGLQSTGKSTLLNTTFGLQFNVSSGRCTRGVFMQMLPIHAELRNDTNCDYVVVVDTEGLRAPELDFLNLQKHDNELATFVIGLANETLINISGEVTGDMNDILQTAVHAFIRMREINLKPSCQFVHQNAGVARGDAKARIGQDSFVQKLNKLTSIAANEEGCGHQYQRFSHVIQFDDQKYVHHFESLWMGDPPMAPVNPGYSKSAQSLKAHLISQVKQTECTNLSSFTDRMKNLWNALMRENFVFNFRNSIQINAFKALEAEYSNIECQLVNKVLDIGRGIENEIMAANNTSSGLEDTKNNTLDKIIETKLHMSNGYLATEVINEHARLKDRLDEYFRKNKQSDVIVQWKANFVTKLEQQAVDLRYSTINRLEQLCNGKKALADIDRKKETYEHKFITEVNRIAEDLQKINTQLNEHQIKHKFDNTWAKIIGSLEKTENKTKDLVKKDMEKELFRFVGSNNEIFLMNELTSQSCEISDGALEMIVQKDKHLTKKTDGSYVKRFGGFAAKQFEEYVPKQIGEYAKQIVGYPPVIHEGHVREAQDVTNILLKKPQTYIARLRGLTYSSTYFTSLLIELQEAVDEQSKKSKEISFTPQYRVDLYLTACRYAVKEFEKMIDEYNTNNDPVTHLERRFKTHLYTMFESKCLQVANDELVIRGLCKLLPECIERQVKLKMGQLIFKSTIPKTYFTTRSALKTKMLIDMGEDLLTTNNFLLFKVYFKDPKESFSYWLKEYLRQHCDECVTDSQYTQVQVLAINEVDKLVSFIERKIMNMKETFMTDITINKWLETFSADTEVIHNLGKVEMTTLYSRTTVENVNIVRFTENIQGKLNEMKVKTKKKFKYLTFQETEDWPPQRALDIMDTATGCFKQCPFCGEICDNTRSHDSSVPHIVSHHRPQCIGGWREDTTGIMCTETCNTLVTGKGKYTKYYHPVDEKYYPYKDYHKKFRDWKIAEDLSAVSSAYWQWLVGNHGDKLADFYSMKINPNAASNWNKISFAEAKRNIE